MVKHLLALLIAFAPFVAQAQSEGSENESRDLLVFDDSATGTQTSESEELKVPYDGKTVEESDVKLADTKEQILFELEKEMQTERDLKNTIYIPKAPATLIEMETFAQLSEGEMKTFIRKKETFLRRFANTLAFIKLKKSWINKAVAEVNAKFYRSSQLIANSNTVGGTVMVSAGAGLALPAKLVAILKSKPIGRFIPDSGGFYYMLGLGAGIVRVVDPMTKKSSLQVELFVDTEKLTKTMTGLIEATAAGTAGVVYEHRSTDFWSQKVDITYGGAAGLFRGGEKHFGWAASLGVSAPPFIGAVLVYTNEGTRRYFARLNLTKVFVDIPALILRKISEPFRARAAMKCNGVY